MEKYKAKLEEEKKLLEEELSTMGKEDSKTGDWEAVPESEISNQDVPDEGDLADRSEDYEERSSALSVLETRLSDVDSAIERLNNGTFGICEICKEKIEEERLEVNPSARTCMSCKEKII